MARCVRFPRCNVLPRIRRDPDNLCSVIFGRRPFRGSTAHNFNLESLLGRTQRARDNRGIIVALSFGFGVADKSVPSRLSKLVLKAGRIS